MKLVSDERGVVGCDAISSGKYISQHSVKTRKIQFMLCLLYQICNLTIQQERVSGQWSGEQGSTQGIISDSSTLLSH